MNDYGDALSRGLVEKCKEKGFTPKRVGAYLKAGADPHLLRSAALNNDLPNCDCKEVLSFLDNVEKMKAEESEAYVPKGKLNEEVLYDLRLAMQQKNSARIMRIVEVENLRNLLPNYPFIET